MPKKSFKYYEDKHNSKFSDTPIKILSRKDKYIYFETEFGICKMYIGNIGKANYSIQSATDKTSYLINKLIKLHGNEYDFSLVKFDGKTSEKVSIICTKHGKFEKTINTLVTKKNVYCPDCYNETIRGRNRISSTEEFIEKAIKVHSFKYDYSLVNYNKAINEVEIICKVHGSFKQTPDRHLSGSGCKECANIAISKRNQENPSGWTLTNWILSSNKSKRFDSFKVYIIECWNEKERFYKIGRTYLSINKRFIGKNEMPYSYKIIKVFIDNAENIYKLEKNLQKINKEYKYIPKIDFCGKYECFSNIKDLINK